MGFIRTFMSEEDTNIAIFPVIKSVTDGPVGQVLAGPLFLKVKANFYFTKRK